MEGPLAPIFTSLLVITLIFFVDIVVMWGLLLVEAIGDVINSLGDHDDLH